MSGPDCGFLDLTSAPIKPTGVTQEATAIHLTVPAFLRGYQVTQVCCRKPFTVLAHVGGVQHVGQDIFLVAKHEHNFFGLNLYHNDQVTPLIGCSQRLRRVPG